MGAAKFVTLDCIATLYVKKLHLIKNSWLNHSLATKEEELIMEKKEGKFGFTNYAEVWNGRLAMIGFITALVVEMNTGHGVLAQFGLM